MNLLYHLFISIYNKNFVCYNIMQRFPTKQRKGCFMASYLTLDFVEMQVEV